LSKFVKTFPDELIHVVGVLLNRFLKGLDKDVRESTEQAFNSVFEGVELDGDTVNLDLIR
jgi:hypothetical protein